MKILVTGGAGFVGSFLVDALIKSGHEVRIFDNLEPQIHNGVLPSYINQEAEFLKGDVRNIDELRKAIENVDVIFHQAAAVGIGQSNYRIRHFVSSNSLGTANILDVLVNENHNVKKLIISSSNTAYGEGKYLCDSCGEFHPEIRTKEDIKKFGFEPVCFTCKKPGKPIPTDENTYLKCNSIYSYTKKEQEETALFIGKTYGIPVTVLRYFNIFGPRQSLSNPYTGVIAIFLSRIKNNKQPVVYEDGLQTRDFVFVYDVVEANILCMKNKSANYNVFNVGSGAPTSIGFVAENIRELLNSEIKPEITNVFRKGDIRHCYADIRKIKSKLDWQPKHKFENGMKELINWSRSVAATDHFDAAMQELKDKGLI